MDEIENRMGNRAFWGVVGKLRCEEQPSDLHQHTDNWALYKRAKDARLTLVCGPPGAEEHLNDDQCGTLKVPACEKFRHYERSTKLGLLYVMYALP
jgi:hypothetical protein